MDRAAEALEPVEIAAGRLRLRPWWSGDAPSVQAACSDPEVVAEVDGMVLPVPTVWRAATGQMRPQVRMGSLSE